MNPSLQPNNVLVAVCNPLAPVLAALEIQDSLTHDNKPLALIYKGLVAVIQFSPEDGLYYTDPTNSPHTLLSEGMTLDTIAKKYKDSIDNLIEYMKNKPDCWAVSEPSVSQMVYAMLNDPKHISNLIGAPEGAECYSVRTESFFKSPTTVWCKSKEEWTEMHRPMDGDLYDDLLSVEYEGIKAVAGLFDTSDSKPTQILKVYEA